MSEKKPIETKLGVSPALLKYVCEEMFHQIRRKVSSADAPLVSSPQDPAGGYPCISVGYASKVADELAVLSMCLRFAEGKGIFGQIPGLAEAAHDLMKKALGALKNMGPEFPQDEGDED